MFECNKNVDNSLTNKVKASLSTLEWTQKKEIMMDFNSVSSYGYYCYLFHNIIFPKIVQILLKVEFMSIYEPFALRVSKRNKRNTISAIGPCHNHWYVVELIYCRGDLLSRVMSFICITTGRQITVNVKRKITFCYGRLFVKIPRINIFAEMPKLFCVYQQGN